MELKKRYKTLFENKIYRKSLLIGLLIILLAAITSSISISYVNTVASNAVEDLFLKELPHFNLFWFRTIGTLLIAISIMVAGILLPKYLPLLLKSTGGMYFIRSLFLPLTHLKFYPSKVPIPKDYLLFNQIPYQGNDLFFSGHVAFPFIATLVFWKEKKLRWTFLSLTVISAFAALLSKTHYSIDVFAAPFIAYGTYKIVEKFSKKDLDLINKIKY